MRFVLFTGILAFTSFFVNALDIRFIIQNHTNKTISVDGSGLQSTEVKSVPREIQANEEAPIVLTVKPEMFDCCKKEKLKLSIDGSDVTYIFIEFPIGSVLLSAVVHNISPEEVDSRSIHFMSDQVCGKQTKWQNTIIVKPVK